MSKPKRNEPCPCGSGKKYKKCCGASNLIAVSPEIYNMELERLHTEVVEFAYRRYENIIHTQAERHFQPFLDDEDELADIYIAGLTFWTILNVPALENNQTIFDAFYRKYDSKIKHSRTRNTFAEWKMVTPSVYEIVSIDSQTTHMATIKELLTDETYQIPYSEDDDFQEGSIAIGTLVPFIQHHDFFYTMLEFIGDQKEALIELLYEWDADKGFPTENFPDFLADALSIGEERNIVG